MLMSSTTNQIRCSETVEPFKYEILTAHVSIHKICEDAQNIFANN